MSSVSTHVSSRPTGAASMQSGNLVAAMCALKAGKELAVERALPPAPLTLPPIASHVDLHGVLLKK